MPKQDHSRDLLPHLDSKISAIRQQCYQLRAEREFLQMRIHDLARDVDALVRHYGSRPPDQNPREQKLREKPPEQKLREKPPEQKPRDQKPREGSDTSSSPSPGSARRNSASLQNLDFLRESGMGTRAFSRSSLSVDDTAIRPGHQGVHNSGPPSCPSLIRSLQSSPVAKGHRKRISPLDDIQRVRSSSHLRPDTSRARSDSQQSLPDSISKDAPSIRDSQQSLPDSISKDAPSIRGSLVHAKSGDVRAASKMSLSSSSPALAGKESPVHGALLGQKEAERIDSMVGLLTSKTCTDL